MYSSIVKKILMAISGIFLMIFLVQHLTINLMSLLPDNGFTFNKVSHFMGHNPIVQFVLQPFLIFGVCFHFIMGFVLELSNYRARDTKYVKHKTSASWASKNMIISGSVILAFLALHFYDFWIPEIESKYIEGAASDPTKYFGELKEKFHNNIIRTNIYCFAFILLGIHLSHGFNSSFKSIGVKTKYQLLLEIMGIIYSILIPFGFILIAIYHCFL